MTDPRRRLPSIERLLADPGVAALLAHAPRTTVVAAARDAVAAARSGRAGVPEDWAAEIADRVRTGTGLPLRRLLNATGVVLHTNLGRAPMADAAVRAVAEIAGGYSSLEMDLPSGARGSRAEHGRARLARLTGAEDALVVNNAAGALVVALNSLAAGGDVVISRGELIEIGGSFRIPEIIGKAGVRLREVGTTNRTHLRDYEDALLGAGAVLLVHRSNFAQHGFVASPEPAAVAALAREAGIPLIHDIGSGLLADLAPYGLSGEPTVQDAVAAGPDLVIFSGDKLLGGPQAGIAAGSATTVERCRKNPLARALRADKMTLAALDATLALYESPELALRDVPVLRMLTEPADSIALRASALAGACPPVLAPALLPGTSAVGGGAFPDAQLPTTLVRLDPGPLGAHALALRLRLGDPPLVARVAGGYLLLDLRTLTSADCTAAAEALSRALDAG